ncbi:YraN family protein [Candidatus Daviesbacteria bacterium]|nr:YraN family protein [Candidatus Daviesbacteria bacterium]
MTRDTRQTGILAETLATKALIEKGFRILENNFSNRFGEIDIIAKDKGILVFVEVKAKKGLEFGTPEEMITPSKLKRVKNMATVYMKGQIVPCRIDVITVILSSQGKLIRLTHYENVYI